MKKLTLGLFLLVSSISNARADVTSCILDTTITDGGCAASYTDPTQLKACYMRVRAKQYALRHWFTLAINKAMQAHFTDFSDSKSLTQLQCYYTNFSAALNSKSLTDAEAKFPELALTSTADQVAAETNFNNLANELTAIIPIVTSSTGAVGQFASSVGSTTWATRLTNGQAAYWKIGFSQLPLLVQYLNYNVAEINYFMTAEAGTTLSCGVFYPLQFAASTQSLVRLIAALPFASSCSDEIYRGIMVQAFTSNSVSNPNGTGGCGPGGVGGDAGCVPPQLIDSAYNIIPYTVALEPSGYSGPTLDAPSAAIAAEIADPKLANAVVDSELAYMAAQNLTTISSDELSSLVANLNAFLTAAVGTNSAPKLSFYNAATSYATSQGGLMPLQIAAAFGEQLCVLNGGATCNP